MVGEVILKNNLQKLLKLKPYQETSSHGDKSDILPQGVMKHRHM